MSIAFAMLLVGLVFVYAGWSDLSIPALLRGDNTSPKAGK